MKLSESWIREWTNPEVDAATIAERLTLAGLEVDGVDAAGAPLPDVVVVEVIAVDKHPQADRLSVCEIDNGQAREMVVCGAPNVRAGMRAAHARPGAELPDGRTIERAEIRGVASAGMLCSAAELGLGDDAGGLLELDADATLGQALATHLALDDAVFDISLTPNRGDCFSVLGVARDLAVVSNSELRPVEVPAIPAQNDATFSVELAQPAACPRYAGRVIRGIRNDARTPLWMVERLRRSGVRAIHPVVDVTNYVMLELGQPLHGFDLDRLEGGIVVRRATAGEALELLDGQTVTLDDETLVIADHGRAVALAGIMGGQGSAVDESTTDVFLESAYFDAIELAGVARRYRLQTDASTRFERGVDTGGQARAIERATALIMEICGGEPGPTSVAEVADAVPKAPVIEFDPAAVNRLLGTGIDDEEIARILRALELEVDAAVTPWRVTPPAFRSDLALSADLVEEVARIHGYDRIPVRLPRGDVQPAEPVLASRREEALRARLCARGYFEAITYSFISEAQAQQFHPGAQTARLSNPISSDMLIMRPGLFAGLLAAAAHNLNRQSEAVSLFEIGQVFPDGGGPAGSSAAGGASQVQCLGGVRAGRSAPVHWNETPRDVDFFDVKQDLGAAIASLAESTPTYHAAEVPGLHPGQTAIVSLNDIEVGVLGALHPALAREYDLNKPLFLFELSLDRIAAGAAPQFAPISKFPAVRRDLSVVVDETVAAEVCLDVARNAAGRLLRDLQLFDVYRGQGIDSDKKSLALGLIFQDVSSTLTDEQVEEAVARVLDSLRERVGGTLRE